MKYKILESFQLSVFESAVRDYLKNGWRLLGGPIVLLGEDDERYYAQAVTREN